MTWGAGAVMIWGTGGINDMGRRRAVMTWAAGVAVMKWGAWGSNDIGHRGQ
jgi:hypothetical protein